MGAAPRRRLRRDRPQPALVPAHPRGLRGARDAPASTPQQQRLVDPALRAVRPPRRQSQPRAEAAAFRLQPGARAAVRRVQREGARRRGDLSSPRPRPSSPASPPTFATRPPRRRASATLPAGQFAIVNTRSAVDPVLTFADNRRAARAGLARLRQSRRQWQRQRHQRRSSPRSCGSAPSARGCSASRATPTGGCRTRWRGTPERAQELMMRVWPAAVARVREEVRRPAGDRAPARPQHHDRALGLSLLYGEGPPRPLQPLPGRDQALFRARQHDRRHVLHGRAALRPALHREYRPGAGLAPGHPHLAGHRPRRAATSASSTATCSPAPASARAPGRPAIAAARACSATTSCSARTTTISPSRRPGEPVLISLDDAETLFHEFGHAIHYFLSNVHYPSLGGTPRDFVEYPSQVHENWVLTPEILNRFALHYQTRQPMPQALVERIQAARQFNQGFATVEYLSSALVDMALHIRPDGVVDPDAFERETLAAARHAARDRDAAPAAAVRPPLLVRRLFGRLLFLPLVGDDGRRHLGGVRGDRQRLGSGDRAALRAAPCSRPATRPTAPKPIAPSAAAIRTSTRCSGSAASRPARLRRLASRACRLGLDQQVELVLAAIRDQRGGDAVEIGRLAGERPEGDPGRHRDARHGEAVGRRRWRSAAPRGQARVGWPAGQCDGAAAPPGPVMVSVAGALASGRQSMTLLAPARQKVPLWVTSTCQIVSGRAARCRRCAPRRCGRGGRRCGGDARGPRAPRRSARRCRGRGRCGCRRAVEHDDGVAGAQRDPRIVGQRAAGRIGCAPTGRTSGRRARWRPPRRRR